MSSPPSREQVTIDLAERSYPILIGPALFDSPATWANVPASAQALVVTNTTVEPLYAQRLVDAIKAKHEDRFERQRTLMPYAHLLPKRLQGRNERIDERLP